ncbi:phosphoserine phosphatase SerB [Campylobacter sp. VicNov18]|uniref:phosphoserine phosphatase SerB n=1 Tax=Campylobacter bilis TaxID=2691918 RepID=UPI00130D74A0|nr:phosphoserine phosphatase SerB [Campylobacter bilis]MPV63242.1 phosphoserine phosphatase SerB [Campylobacter hepaticus]MBM0636741.1 phosphoserine phosphatase SerB [Campylobacter bilis]MCC8277313.1 phosphoserine phosphatase SerB [Campylobacter bilis]MCC8299056.1 phosphoserine phosphatase SerB [Campylobacter bilis]MCC8300222.1 phosphoserine phosphatase SerB [Campylobacter bilis]
MIKLCVFDFDSTLMDGETIDILAMAHGKGEETSEITRRAMAGELDFFESLQKRVSLLKGMAYERVIKIGSMLPLMQGSYNLIQYLNSKNIQIVIFSGGFHEGIDPAMEKLGIKMGYANYLHHKNGVLTGLLGGEMMFSNSKGLMLQRLKNFLNLKTEEVMCVGDGANDIAMFYESGLKIAFCAKEILRSQADICIDTKNLEEIIKVI